ncbi:exosortase F system-associated protein [Aureisphaera galaxeae]|uniref:exosortase F system-associated membrane protein n=1 Tax=Aureisphaera galaxeae TaxID=1538023 RepID=UPI0023501C54|nr:exosortase F system-associated protein [Aureisphaera galaxeae]MDC8003051.1 exosortase F system-associated protein [Aureisphaera galaxeae]
MKKWVQWTVVVLLFGLLVLIRAYASDLFYDPLIVFFETTHSTDVLPEMDIIKLLGNTSLRFLMNTAISLLILWVIFKRSDVIKVSALLYACVFVLLMIFFWILLGSDQAGGHMALFYIRRFLIQPVFVLLLIPAFYFQKNL